MEKKKTDGITRCNHSVNSKNSTIELIKNCAFLVSPIQVFGICNCCHKTFKFEKVDENRFKRIK